METRIRDHIWIWGHMENMWYPYIHRETHVTPMQGVAYMDAKNLLYGGGEFEWDKAAEYEASRNLPAVGWCIERAAKEPENVTELCEAAKKYPNIRMGMFDDFFSMTNPTNNYTNYTPEMLAKYRAQLHEAGVAMWVVLYTQNFPQMDAETIQMYLKEFDGVSLWYWEEEEADLHFDEHMEYFLKLAADKRRMVGCYVYNFDQGKEARPEVVEKQLDKNAALLKNGSVEGVILLSNAMFGTNPPFEAVERAKAWMDAHGDEKICR